MIVCMMLMLLSSMQCWCCYLTSNADAMSYELTDSLPDSLGYRPKELTDSPPDSWGYQPKEKDAKQHDGCQSKEAGNDKRKSCQTGKGIGMIGASPI